MSEAVELCGNCNTLSKKQLLKQHTWAHICTYKHIDNHYRKPRACIRHCFSTLFALHNETTNIWTHLVGIFLFVGLMAKMICNTENIWDIAIWSVYFLSAIAVCFCSTIYHIFSCHSRDVHNSCFAIDCMTISTLVFSSNLVVAYFELKNHWNLFVLLTAINVFAMFVTTMMKYYEMATHHDLPHLFKFVIYIVYGFGVVVELFVKWFVDGYVVCSPKSIFLCYLCYATVGLNAFHLPERIVPKNTFVELFGYSHNIFHIGVVAGVLVMWKTYA